MTADPRTPVIVGVGQVNHVGGDAPEPVDLLATAAHRAARDAGAPGILAAVESVRVVNILSRRYRDPGALVAARIGAPGAHTVATAMGGNIPQALIDRAVIEIGRGEVGVVLIGGAESWRTRNVSRGRGERPPWPTHDGDATATPSERFGTELTLTSPAEAAHGLVLPVQAYPLFENALRAAAGRSLPDHVTTISELWSRFAAVAVDNPYAAIRRAYAAEEIARPGPANRMVCYPYTKLMNSNNSVDQGAALIICSVGAARSAGVATDRWVWLHGAGEANDTAVISHRDDFVTSPAVRLAGRAALDAAGVGIDDVAFVDLYSCFPSAVQIAAAELGLRLGRQLTLTGGLTFAGGPWNNYVTHSVATLVGALRREPDAVGMCTANGGLLTKHAVGIYAAHPPTTPSSVAGRVHDVQPQVDSLPTRAAAGDGDGFGDGPVTIETYTVAHHRDGEPETAFVAARLPDGRRAWATSRDPDLLELMEHDEVIGRAAEWRADTIHLAD